MGSENISRPTKYYLGSIQMFTDYFPTWTAIMIKILSSHLESAQNFQYLNKCKKKLKENSRYM